MQLSPDSPPSRAFPSHVEDEAANSPILEPQVTANGHNQTSLSARMTVETAGDSPYATARSSCHSQQETAASPRCGAPYVSDQSCGGKMSEELSKPQSAIKKPESLQQALLQRSHGNAPEEPAQEVFHTKEQSPHPDRDAREKSASMQTANTQINALESGIAVRIAKGGSSTILEATYNTELGDAERNGCQLGNQSICHEPATPLTTKPCCFPVASFEGPAICEVFQTPPSDCRTESSRVPHSFPVAEDSDEDSSPVVPQSTVRKGSRQVVSSDDEEQHSQERSLPFLTAITCFDSTFSRPSHSTAGSGYAPFHPFLFNKFSFNVVCKSTSFVCNLEPLESLARQKNIPL